MKFSSADYIDVADSSTSHGFIPLRWIGAESDEFPSNSSVKSFEKDEFETQTPLKILKEVAVPKDGKENEGMVKLLCHYKSIFRTAENLDHYSESDFREAEKKFLRYVLFGHEMNTGQREN